MAQLEREKALTKLGGLKLASVAAKVALDLGLILSMPRVIPHLHAAAHTLRATREAAVGVCGNVDVR